jgi:tetratricopeptide (TPR) repeat protein
MDEIEEYRRLFKSSRKLPDPKIVFQRYPDGIREYLIFDLVSELGLIFLGLDKPFTREQERINRRFISLLEKASEFETEGNLEKAIYHYEKMTELGFPGNHPYERLRVIYSRLKNYDDAIRACLRFVEIATTLVDRQS